MMNVKKITDDFLAAVEERKAIYNESLCQLTDIYFATKDLISRRTYKYDLKQRAKDVRAFKFRTRFEIVLKFGRYELQPNNN